MSKQNQQIFEVTPNELGAGAIQAKFSPNMNYIAAIGASNNLKILDRRGNAKKEIPLPFSSPATSIDWDMDSDTEGTNIVLLWPVFTKQEFLEINIGEGEQISFQKWSHTHPILAVGTKKGGLIFYNKKTKKKMPTVFKHSKQVTDGDWNSEGNLITVAKDKSITISDHNSETIYNGANLGYDIEKIYWTKLKIENREENEQQKSFCAVISQRNILLFNLMSSKQPFQLIFEAKYGKIVDYCLFGDGYLVIAFSNGYLSHVSTHQKEMEQEIESDRIFQSIDSICVNEYLYKCAVAGEGNKIKFYNMKNWKELKKECISLPENKGRPLKMTWSKNGQLLLVTTNHGYLLGYLTHLPRLFSYHQNKLALLSSFTLINLNYITDGKMDELTSHKLEVEPTFLSIGATHLVSGMNNYAYLYKFFENGAFFQNFELIKKGDYFTMIQDAQVSDSHLVVLTENKCYIEELSQTEDKIEIYPHDDSEPRIKSIYLNNEFLIMSDSESKIIIYSTKERSVCNSIRCDSPIQKIWPNSIGNKAVCVDKSGRGFLFNFLSEKETEIQGFLPQMNKVLWDTNDPNLFIGCSTDAAYTFIHNKHHYKGDSCSIVYELLSLEDVEKTNEPSFTTFDGVEPVYVQAGSVICLTKSNNIQSGWLGSHSSYANFTGSQDDQDTNLRYFFQNLMLGKFENALSACTMVPEDDRSGSYMALATLALKNMNIPVAKKAYQLSGNISMVFTLDSLLNIEEKKILQGFISMVLCEYQAAQEYLLGSSHPELGLDLRCDTREWSIALNLAENMAPGRMPFIRRRFAEDQEKQGQHSQALKNFQNSIIDDSGFSTAQKEKVKIHNMMCQAGTARTSIRTDNVMRGFEIGQDLEDKDLVWEIATALEEVKAQTEAAELFEKSEDYEKAATLYIASKNFKKAEKLIDKLHTPKVLASLAKMKETEGKFKDAETAYVRARDWESVIKINLNKLNDYNRAVTIFKEKSPTQACANILAEYCEQKGMRAETIKFMVLAGKHNDAFSKAQVYQEMDMYADSLEEMNEKEALKIAQYYEGVSKFKSAGVYYEKAAKFTNALDCYLNSGDEALNQAIDCVSKSQNETLFFKMLDFLEGDDKHDPKDPKYAFKLYLMFGKIEEASKIAIAIVKSEMEDGNYKEAHRILIDMLTEILERKAKISFDLIQKIIIIHSYTLTKKLIKLDEHLIAAKLLDRVCNNIKLFPKHDSTIMTQTVIEASKAGLKATAFRWAAQLCKPEFRDKIIEKLKKNIENIARKPSKEEAKDPESMCPFCVKAFSDFELSCPHCSSNVPFCIASGRHLSIGNLSKCPKCEYCGYTDVLTRFLELDPVCPMCQAEVQPSTLEPIPQELQNVYLRSISFGNIDEQEKDK